MEKLVRFRMKLLAVLTMGLTATLLKMDFHHLSGHANFKDLIGSLLNGDSRKNV